MKYIIVLILSVVSLSLMAQDINPCGTLQGRSPWLKNFQLRPAIDKSNARTDDIILVPLTIHMMAADNWGGLFRDEKLLQSLCNLNDVFMSSDIQFYIHTINYVASSDMFYHNDVITGGKYMLEHNVPNTLNCYIVGDPASNCGYNLPWAGIALGTNCLKPTDLTWAHEIGHALSLPHPFFGWEGGQNHDGTIPANYNAPAPEFVTYDYTDFKKVLYEDTLIIDTAIVELVDRSNCYIAADGFCDTEADYLSFRWTCNQSGESNVNQIDPLGVSFTSKGEYLMGYSSATNKTSNPCTGIFTEEQIQAMRANLLEEKTEWLNQTSDEIDGVDNETVNHAPTDKELVNFEQVNLSWNLASGEADKYIVQIALNDKMTALVFDTIVNEPMVSLENLSNDKTYYWNVRAFDNNEFCTEYSDSHGFKTADLSGTGALTIKNCTVYPTVVTSSSAINLVFKTGVSKYNYTLTDRNGFRILAQKDQSASRIALPVMSDGIYFLNITTNQNTEVFKLMVY